MCVRIEAFAHCYLFFVYTADLIESARTMWLLTMRALTCAQIFRTVIDVEWMGQSAHQTDLTAFVIPCMRYTRTLYAEMAECRPLPSLGHWHVSCLVDDDATRSLDMTATPPANSRRNIRVSTFRLIVL